MKTTNGIITEVMMGKQDAKSLLITTHKENIPVSFEDAAIICGADASPMEVLAFVRASGQPTVDKVWIHKKVVAHIINGNSAVPTESKDLIGKEFYCTYHQKGDILKSKDAEGNDKEIIVTNNDTLTDNGSVSIH